MKSIPVAFLVCLCVGFLVSSSAPPCPSDNSAEVYFADSDCSKYWQCSNGVAYLRPCPANLNWNVELNTCDWPASAGCTGEGWSTTTARSTNSSNAPASTTPQPTSTSRPSTASSTPRPSTTSSTPRPTSPSKPSTASSTSGPTSTARPPTPSSTRRSTSTISPTHRPRPTWRTKPTTRPKPTKKPKSTRRPKPTWRPRPTTRPPAPPTTRPPCQWWDPWCIVPRLQGKALNETAQVGT